MNKSWILLTVGIFLMGLVSGSFYGFYFGKNSVLAPEVQSSPDYEVSQLGSQDSEFGAVELLQSENENRDKPSPKNWIDRSKIFVYNDEVILKIDNPQWAVFTDTKSMDPVIDSTSKAIEVVPQSEADISVGDIVAYESKYKDGVIAHRVVEIGSDSSGWYARIKGDNNDYVDPGKVRFEQIKRIVVAVIY
ncbi:MAG TPA: hypothetical protein VI564_00655 [Candidatus Nanoarchaeia archaeon]|nr:hypothetical protein [Candidatus Nanoarchaeia archaeon]